MLYLSRSIGGLLQISAQIVSFNWVDVLVAVIIVRIIISARKSNIFAEILKFLGIICATWLAIHYYTPLGNLLKQWLVAFGKNYNLIAFAVILLLVILFFILIIEGWRLILNFQIHPLVDEWGRVFFSILRSLIIGGLVLFALLISGDKNFEASSRQSLSSVIFQDIPIDIYENIYQGLIFRIFPDEPINTDALKLKRNAPPKTEEPR